MQALYIKVILLVRLVTFLSSVILFIIIAVDIQEGVGKHIPSLAKCS